MIELEASASTMTMLKNEKQVKIAKLFQKKKTL